MSDVAKGHRQAPASPLASVGLSAHQLRALAAMDISVWTPRRRFPVDGPLAPSAQPPVRSKVAGTPEIRPPPPLSKVGKLPRQTVESDVSRASAAPRASGPDIRFQALSLGSSDCHVLIDDAVHAEVAFWLDFLRSLRGFRADASARREIRKRFDWPLPGLLDASRDAAQKALLGFLHQERFVCLRGDSLANLVFGADGWQSFPHTHRLANADVWVFGSDVDLKSAGVRRVLWEAIGHRASA